MTQNTPTTVPAVLPTISLYLKEGGSDKEYHARIERKGDGFVVNVAYGRRGGTLQTGTKTPQPVSYEKALKEYQKVVKEKTGKGYSEGMAGQRFSGTSNEARVSPFVPQLLNPIELSQADALLAGAWWMEEKKDGHRRLVHKQGTLVQGINRRGLYVALPEGVTATLQGAQGDVVLDGELVGQKLYVFDILHNGQDLRGLGLAQRSALLDQWFDTLPQQAPDVVRVQTAKTPEEKRRLFDALRMGEREGVVFKNPAAPYTPGRPHAGGDQLKLKFVATASLLVLRINSKRSVLMGLYNAAGELVEVGNVTVPSSHEVPKPEDVIEVAYLYAFPNGALFQPVYRGVRDDIPPQECRLDQLKLKPLETDETAEGGELA